MNPINRFPREPVLVPAGWSRKRRAALCASPRTETPQFSEHSLAQYKNLPAKIVHKTLPLTLFVGTVLLKARTQSKGCSIATGALIRPMSNAEFLVHP
jgi:hypothetical protein